jgi:hypothetical protein
MTDYGEFVNDLREYLTTRQISDLLETQAKAIEEKDARIAELEAALNLADKLAISVLGSWDAFEAALRSEIGNTNYRCVAEKVAEYRDARAALKGEKIEN